jgi:branched-subunit amino acid transport protein
MLYSMTQHTTQYGSTRMEILYSCFLLCVLFCSSLIESYITTNWWALSIDCLIAPTSKSNHGADTCFSGRVLWVLKEKEHTQCVFICSYLLHSCRATWTFSFDLPLVLASLLRHKLVGVISAQCFYVARIAHHGLLPQWWMITTLQTISTSASYWMAVSYWHQIILSCGFVLSINEFPKIISE